MVPTPEMRQDIVRMAGVAPRFAAVLGAGSLVAACAWVSLDAIAPAPAAGDAQPPPVDAPPADASGGFDDGPPISPSSPACAAPATPVNQWTFDSTVEGWSIETDTGAQATLAWSAATGDPAPGSLQADVTPSSSDASLTGAWVRFLMTTPADLTGRTISAWAWLDSGQSPHLKTFVQTGAMYEWADNGTIFLGTHQWTCLSLPVSTPSYSQPSYDPTKVVALGFEMLGTGPFRLFIDSVRYY
jgi:hypothetical protein